jgi:hypothetical protein
MTHWTRRTRRLLEQAVDITTLQAMVDTLNTKCASVADDIASDTVEKDTRFKDSVLDDDERTSLVKDLHTKETVTCADRGAYFTLARGGRTRFLIDKTDGTIYAAQQNATPNLSYDYGTVKAPKLKELTIALIGSWHGHMVKEDTTNSMNVYHKDQQQAAVDAVVPPDTNDDEDEDVNECAVKTFKAFTEMREDDDPREPDDEPCSWCRKEPASEKHYPYCSKECASEAAQDSPEDAAYEAGRDAEDE